MYERGSAEVDWCENNYAYNTYVAEFFNTLSSAPLTFLPMIGFYLNQDYYKRVNKSVKYVYFLFVFVGVTSAYFHATLSLLGQLLDELGLLWVGVVSYVVWLPRMRTTPVYIKKHSQIISRLLLCSAAVASLLSFIQPAINAYFLMLLCIPTFISMFHELRRATDPTANTLGAICTAGWGLGVAAWIGDRTICDYWIEIGFPYFHAVWHVLSAYSSYCAIILFSYLDAKENAPRMQPCVRFVPKDSLIKVPYLCLKIDDEQVVHQNGFTFNNVNHH